MSTFYSLYVSRAIKGIDLLKRQTYKDINSYSFCNGKVYKYITTWIYHFTPEKSFTEWVWSKWVSFVSTLSSSSSQGWKDDEEIKNVYTYWFGRDIMNSEKVKEWMSTSPEDILKYMCNCGLAAHMVTWCNDSYIVDLRSMSLPVQKGLFPYGCLLALNASLEPRYIRMDYAPVFFDGKVVSYEKREFTSYKGDDAWEFAKKVFLTSLIVKTILIDKTLCSRFIYSGNIISSVYKYKDKLPQDFINFIKPFVFTSIKGNQRVFEEFMGNGGLYDRVFGFENVANYVSHEAEFWYWESPEDLFYKNIYKDVPKDRKMPNIEPEKLSKCTSCRTNRKFPRWYWDAIKYWKEVELFVGEWVKEFWKTDRKGVEEWLEFYEHKKPGKNIHFSVKERLVRVLTSLIWNVSFFHRHVSIGKWVFRPGINSKIYLEELSRYDNIGMATIALLSEAEYKPQMIGSLWLTQDERYKELWIKFERRVERLEFKALDVIGGELECCV